MSGFEGHRARLKERYLAVGKKALSEHELLELLLFYSLPRRDVKPLAKQLLDRFGSLEGVLSADVGQLVLSKGIGINSALMLKLVCDISEKIMLSPAGRKLCLDDEKSILSYLHSICRSFRSEKLVVLMLDGNRFLADTLIFDGKFGYLTVQPHELLHKITACRNARQVIVAHNHLMNGINASKTDVRNTILLDQLLSKVGIVLLDHIIVCPNGESLSLMNPPCER